MITLAVVPILLQGGQAVLPSLLAAAGTIFAIILRPKDWLRLGREKPVATALIVAGLFLAGWSLFALKHRKAGRSAAATDWSQVALEMLRREEISASHEGGRETTAHLQPAWEFKRPGVSFLSSPACRDGRLYGASCQIDVGGTYGSIFCLEAATGRLLWEVVQIDGEDLKGIFSSPALSADGTCLVIGEGLHFDADCRLICLEALTGKVRWKSAVPKNHIESSPAILGDVVVVGAGAIERANHLPVEAAGQVLCVRISDGQVLWRREVIDPESSPALGPDRATYIGSGISGSAVVALDAGGQKIWQTSTPYPATGAVALTAELAVAGCGRGDFVNAAAQPAGAVLAFDQSTGKIRWQSALADAVLGRIIIGDGKVFCPVRDGTVVALNAADGKVVWSQRISAAPVLAGTARSGDFLYAVSSDGFLAILEAKSGRLIELHTLNDEASPGRRNLCLSTPLVADGRVFVGSETGGLRCFVEAAHR